jgi:hypothetical protein
MEEGSGTWNFLLGYILLHFLVELSFPLILALSSTLCFHSFCS